MNKSALFRISYGLYVVTSTKGEEKNGFIGNTTFQITSNPTQIAIGVSVNNYTHEFIRQSKIFAVSVINRDATMELIQTFGYKSGKDIDKFANIAWHTGENGAPLIDIGVNATFECNVVQEVNLDTHTIFIGKVTNGNIVNDSIPLTYEYFRNKMKGKAPVNAPTFVEDESPQTANNGKYVCSVCKYEYDPEIGDPEHGIPPGTKFEDILDDWKCPVCNSPKKVFKSI